MTREAFATGYAEDGTLPVPAWARAACEAALTLDAPVAVRAGRLEGRRAGLERRRQRLYAAHRTSVLTHAATLAAAVNIADLASALDQGDDDNRRQAAKDAALAILLRTLLTTDGLTFRWHQANAAAYADAAAEGQAQAVATPVEGGPASPRHIRRGAGLVTAAAWQYGREWTDVQLGGLAGDLAGVPLADPDETALAIRTVLHRGAGVSFYLEDQMHRAAVTGFSVFADAAGATLAFVTMGDGRVCPTCLGIEAGNPWTPADLPQPPIHGACRCWPEVYATSLALVA